MQTINNAQELVSLGQSFDTAKEVPVFYGTQKTLVDKYKGIYNNTEKALAQVVSKHYQIIQHKDVLTAVGEVLQAKKMPVTGMASNFGNQMRVDLVFGTKDVPVKDDATGIRLGMRVLNSYNKSTSFRLELFGYRLVCSNGMVLGKALGGIKEVTFHMGAEKTLAYLKETVSKFMDRVIKSSAKLQALVNEAIKDSLEWQQVGVIMEKLLAHKKHRNAICEKLGIGVIEVYNKKTKKRSFSYVLDNKDNKKLSRWDIYNAITDYASHTEKMGRSIEVKMQETAQKILKNNKEKLIEMEIRAV